MKSFVVGLAVLGLLACDSSTAAKSNSSVAALAQHQLVWSHRAFHSYSYDYMRAGIGSANVHVIVTADVVTSVIDLTTGEPPVAPTQVPTIDDLFAAARSFFDDDLNLDLAFDAQYGYPTKVFATDNNPGGGYEVRVSSLQPID